jgi:aspartate/tyrosine/aromatic aminotransferase
MTRLLERAIRQAQALPEAEQDAIAAVILEEMESEQQWQAAFAASQDQLAALAQEALAEFRAGTTSELDPDTL